MHIKFIKTTIILALGGLLQASSLEIYTDGAKYSTIPINNFIGLTRGVKGTCDGQDIALDIQPECPDGFRLCKELLQLEDLNSKKNEVAYESNILQQILSSIDPKELDANKWIEAASRLSKQKSILVQKSHKISKELKSRANRYNRQAPSKDAIYSRSKCSGELELTIPSGLITAKLLYQADVNNEDQIHIKQHLAILNRSGIDISAKDLYVYEKSHKIYLAPQTFNPWVAQKRKMQSSLGSTSHYNESVKQKRLIYEAPSDVRFGNMASEPMAVLEADSISQTSYKSYHASSVELPSTGEEIRVKIADYYADTKCQYISYPYMNNKLYKECSFSPASAIESNHWRIQNGKRLVTSNAYGEYRNGKYLLKVGIDDEVLIEHQPIVAKDKSSGIFGSYIKKKDGYTISLENISDKPKKFVIVERIPTSSTDQIEVKLLKIDGANDYKLIEDGRLELSIEMKPKQSKEIKILFELSYNKKIKVSY